jgi:thiol-disulfide isomerase/thioredoxin
MINFRSISLSLLAVLLAGAAFPQTSFKVSGKIAGLKDGSKVSLVSEEGQEKKQLAEGVTRGGSFVLTGKYTRPTMCQLQILQSNKKDPSRMHSVAELRLILEKDPITVSAKASDMLIDTLSLYKETLATIRGGRYQTEYNEYKNATRSQEIISLEAGYKEADAWFKNGGNEDALVGLKKIAADEAARLAVSKDAFMRQHPTYAISAYLAYKNITDLFKHSKEELQAYADVVKDNADTARVNYIHKILPRAMRYACGAPYTDFTGTTPEGTAKKLSECMVPGTYTLIDFWASWCGPCRSAIPKVKALSEQYKGRLTVVSVSVDAKVEDWKKAEQEEKMPWQQLLVAQSDLSGTVGAAYDIESIPRLVLLNDKGGLVLVTFDPRLLASKLHDIFK